MTIGFTATIYVDGKAGFLMAADSRASTKDGDASDIAIKTYSLDRRAGAVGSGNAISIATAVEVTRGIVADHNSEKPDEPVNFYNIVRVFSYFLDQSERDRGWSKGCEVVLVGFLMNGNPAMAKVITKPGKDSVAYFYAPTQPSDLISMVGQTDAKEQILAAIGLNYSLPQLQWAGAAAGTIWYLCQHQGEQKIGGGVALAVCPIDGPMYWPTVSVGGRLFLRGVDITECAEPDARTVGVAYDEIFHDRVDRERAPIPQKDGQGYEAIVRYVKDWVKPKEVFIWNSDPSIMSNAMVPSRPRATVIVGTHGELANYPAKP